VTVGGNKYRQSYRSTLRCDICGTTKEIVRPGGQRRAQGHVKHTWCHKCRDRTAHIEGGED